MEKTKSIQIIIIAVIISVILSVGISFVLASTIKGNNSSNVSISDFKIEYSELNDLEKSMTAYPETDRKGIVTCPDTQNTYLLVLETTSKNVAEIYPTYGLVYVLNGRGEFPTHLDFINKCETKIIGFQILNK